MLLCQVVGGLEPWEEALHHRLPLYWALHLLTILGLQVTYKQTRCALSTFYAGTTPLGAGKEMFGGTAYRF